jgi:hypothetical protein
MSENTNSLEQRAAAALERLNSEKESPVAPTANTEEYDVIAPPPTDAEMAAAGAATATQLDASPAVDDDDEAIITGSTVTTKPLTDEDETVILTTAAKSQMGNMPEDQQNAFLESIMPEIADYRKKLIVEQGLTPAEAAEAAQNRLKSKAAEANTSYGNEHPDGVIITIDKSQEKELELDEDTTRKLQTAKAIKLVVVDSMELETLKVKGDDKIIPMSRIRDIGGSLAHYSVPLLDYGDYATFRGAQSGALVNATSDDDDSVLEILDKKATLLYNYFQGGTYQSRFNEKGEVKSYEDFCNWFKYGDMDMGVYAIVTASSTEVSESTYRCGDREKCNKSFNISYNNKSLLDLSEIPDTFKERVTAIDEGRNSTEAIAKLVEQYGMHTRMKSPFSQNIYEMGSPTIAQARSRMEKCMDAITASNAINAMALLYIEKAYVYDPQDDSYILVDFDEDPHYAFQVLETFHQVDIELLMKWLNDNSYAPQFKIKTKCPHCGREAVDRLRVDDMIFLHARASLTEIQ